MESKILKTSILLTCILNAGNLSNNKISELIDKKEVNTFYEIAITIESKKDLKRIEDITADQLTQVYADLDVIDIMLEEKKYKDKKEFLFITKKRVILLRREHVLAQKLQILREISKKKIVDLRGGVNGR